MQGSFPRVLCGMNDLIGIELCLLKDKLTLAVSVRQITMSLKDIEEIVKRRIKRAMERPAPTLL